MSDTEYCSCGHHKREHNRTYDWAPKMRYCSGYVTAHDANSEGDRSSSRGVYCQCSDFFQVDEWQISEWREYGQLPE